MNNFLAEDKGREADGFVCPFGDAVSIKGKVWQTKSVDMSRIEQLMQAYDLPEIVARLIILRGFDQCDDIQSVLHPNLKDNFPDPFALTGMAAVADIVGQSVMDGRVIGILADFDVDGATSCAVLKRFLMALGQENVPTFIPDRLNDGYGPSIKGFDALKDEGADIVITLDCGITSIEPLAHAKSIGLETIIVDHHEPDEQLPNADYIIDPKLKQDTSGYDYMAAVGVTFLLVVAVNSVLKKRGFYTGKGIDAPDMKTMLDLVALGTVCDMVPLVEANRLFVKYGFPIMAQGANVGLNALLNVSKIKTMPDPYHAGFMLGPRINAGSRVHQSHLGADLLSTQSEEEAMRIAWLLDDCNEKRKSIQKDMTKQATDKAKSLMINHPDMAGLVIDGQGWHTGVSGLVAGNIKDKFEKPTCVIAYVENEDGVLEGRGSGRSVPGVHVANIFMDAQRHGLLLKGGGHAMAGGFTVAPDKVEEFSTFFSSAVQDQLSNDNVDAQTQADDVDLLLSVQSLTMDTAKLVLQSLAPYGMGNPEPITVLSDVIVEYAAVMGANHLRCTVKDCDRLGAGMKAVAFKAMDNDLGGFLMQAANHKKPVHLRGQIVINEWQGHQSVEFHISDAMQTAI